MSSPTDPQAWVDKAEEDYKIAQLTLRRKQPLTYGATYHMRSSVVKSISRRCLWIMA